uniref:Uncharacterized protein n=1 Tax=Anguilla anguilla TaxID=7936 RepID=A0A0E9S614_ANGAN
MNNSYILYKEKTNIHQCISSSVKLVTPFMIVIVY